MGFSASNTSILQGNPHRQTRRITGIRLFLAGTVLSWALLGYFLSADVPTVEFFLLYGLLLSLAFLVLNIGIMGSAFSETSTSASTAAIGAGLGILGLMTIGTMI